MEDEKILVERDSPVEIRCPSCRKIKSVPFSKIAGKHNLKVRCACDAVFKVNLEFRDKHRTKTDLTGYIGVKKWGATLSDSEENPLKLITCRVTNVSVHGVGLIPLNKHMLKEGDEVKVSFVLDTDAAPTIEKGAFIRSANEKYIGVEFAEDEKNDPKLGFYVL